jgi:hypothetical protein
LYIEALAISDFTFLNDCLTLIRAAHFKIIFISLRRI